VTLTGAIPRARLGVVVVIAASAFGGCAAGGHDVPTAGGAGAAGSVAAAGGQAMIDAQASLARCLRRHGVDMPDPSARGFAGFDPHAAGISDDELRTAEAGCARERRAVANAAPKLSNEDRRSALDRALRYARCMRTHGQDVADPRQADAGGGMAIDVPTGAQDDPSFEAATRDCDQVLRQAGP